MSARRMTQMLPLCRALADHAAPFFTEWGGRALARRHRALIDEVGASWRALDALPRTLIHNDFNPRNFALRGTPEAPTLCAYDWELATLAVPQRDLAELCCFVLGTALSRLDVIDLVELHRAKLQESAGQPIDSETWRLGFRLSLQDLLVTRFPMYVLGHRVQPQRFLPRILRTWQTLDEQLSDHTRPVRQEVAG